MFVCTKCPIARSPIAHSEKGNPAQTKREWEAMGMRVDATERERKNAVVPDSVLEWTPPA
ncbi:MAG: hypothetical protein COV30_00960 [Candidatus Yanofskybacteria bacterium CG10_big_fil_rev_8_21_14_0_10_37_15]|uniref:Uncharacterized protein n=1 Tax=Candidatus Yanofskybacteria bacterium CG10_big_fil_rev_8_21_14_0_10_37_15 TaxID=1975097 RepID=A0A2H0R5Z1_9BACT|nr:MAG: hypothetical protein COV30_00960 [Candidatus Yanofskybacteria bacterium CG10_big_fil_rev_8_21_14_0_10_37_15]